MTQTTTTEPIADATERSGTRRAWNSIDPALVAILAGATALRFATLTRQSIWFDEWVTQNDITGGITGLWSRIKESESTPPLFFAVETLWQPLFGRGDFAFRAPSALAGVAAVVVMYFVARELGLTRRIARIVALLTAVHPFLIWYSQEARAYSLLTFLSALTLLGFARAYRRGSRFDYVFFGLASACALWTHYFAIFLIAPLLAVLLVTHRHQFTRVLLGGFFIAWSVASLYPLASHQHDTRNLVWIRGFPFHFRLTEAGRHALVGIGVWNSLLWRSAGAVVVIAIVLLAVKASSEERHIALLMFCVGAAAVVVPAIFERRYFVDRNSIAALLPLILVVAIGLGAQGVERIAVVAVTVLVAAQLFALGGMLSDQREQRVQWQALAALAHRDGTSHAIVFDNSGSIARPLLRYVADGRAAGWDEVIRVHELDYVRRTDEPRRCDGFYGQPCWIWPTENTPPMTLWRTYQLYSHAAVGGLRVDRYRARGPQLVRVNQLLAARGNDAMVVLVPGRRA